MSIPRIVIAHGPFLASIPRIVIAHGPFPVSIPRIVIAHGPFLVSIPRGSKQQKEQRYWQLTICIHLSLTHKALDVKFVEKFLPLFT